MHYLSISEQNFEKNYCHIRYQHHQICQLQNFPGKTKMPKFGTKNVLFKYS